jgi:hypothetical protein
VEDGSLQVLKRDEAVFLEPEDDAKLVECEVDLFVRGVCDGLFVMPNGESPSVLCWGVSTP